MLGAWIFAFVIGALLGRSPAIGGYSCGFQLNWLFIFLIFMKLSKPAWTRARTNRQMGLAILMSLASIWGYENTAPVIPTGVQSVFVTRVAVEGEFQGPVITKALERSFELQGPQVVGATGRGIFIASRRLFAQGRAEMRASYVPSLTCGRAQVFCRLAVSLRQFILSRISYMPAHLQSWLAGLLLGQRSEMAPLLKEAFKTAGLIHVLSVSGLHVTFLAFAFSFFLRVPGQVAYSLRLISPQSWRRLAAALSIMSVLAAWFYAAMTGMNSATLRAMFVYAVHQLSLVFCGHQPLKDRLLLVSFLQTLLLPQGFLSEGTLMSWCGYLLLAEYGGAFGLQTWRQKFHRIIFLQSKMTILAVAFFAQLSLPGILVNLLFLPIFPVIFASAFFAVIWPARWSSLPAALALDIQEIFLAFLEKIRWLCHEYTWLFWDETELYGVRRALFLVLSLVLILNTCRRLSIRSASSLAIDH